MDYTKIFDSVYSFAKEHEKPSRFEHSLRVASLCRQLCLRFGDDGERGYFAGVAHDMCKDFDSNRLLSLSERDGLSFFSIEKEKPSLLHGRAAAVLLREDFCLDDEELLEAIAFHTFAKIDFKTLGMCLFVADKIEPGRSYVTKEYTDYMLSLPLEKMVCTIIEQTETYLKKRDADYKPYPDTPKILEYYKSLCEN